MVPDTGLNLVEQMEILPMQEIEPWPSSPYNLTLYLLSFVGSLR
jgi:hypothetical protein